MGSLLNQFFLIVPDQELLICPVEEDNVCKVQIYEDLFIHLHIVAVGHNDSDLLPLHIGGENGAVANGFQNIYEALDGVAVPGVLLQNTSFPLIPRLTSSMLLPPEELSHIIGKIIERVIGG